MDRRQFLVSAAVAASPLAGRADINSIDLRLGVQLWMLRDELTRDFTGCLKRVAEIGFKRVELYDLPRRSAAELRGALAASKLECLSAHVTLPELEADFPGILDRARQIGIRTLVVPSPWLSPVQQEKLKAGDFRQVMTEELTPDNWKITANLLNVHGEKLRQVEMQLAYHNHNFDFRKFGGVTGYDIMLAIADPKLVRLQLDCGWLASASLDPVAFIKRWGQRIVSLHVKDVQAGFTPNVKLETVPIEIGKGVLKWEEILPAAYQAGIQEFYLEQEGPYLRPPLDSLKISYQYLTNLAWQLQ
jgi:sugar phosphate isomerase/epimerase